jgi:hypothetical protein
MDTYLLSLLTDKQKKVLARENGTPYKCAAKLLGDNTIA